jgi:uncharacterized protein (TIGR01777 family)
VTGATGMIGTALVQRLRAEGHRVRTVGRRGADVRWDPMAGAIEQEKLEGVQAVVHLAGEPIAQRWTDAAKRAIRESRVRGTELLARALTHLATKPTVLVSTSAVGIYGDRGDEVLDEGSALGHGFLGDVARAWEHAAKPARDAGIRVVHPRLGIVLSPSGGALAKLLPVFRLGAGGRIADGRQFMSWIALEDTIRGILHLVHDASLEGPVNLTAPSPVRNAEFTEILAHELHRPALAVVPAFAIRLLYGEMGGATVIGGQRVLPQRLQAAGFDFRYPTLPQALRAVL